MSKSFGYIPSRANAHVLEADCIHSFPFHSRAEKWLWSELVFTPRRAHLIRCGGNGRGQEREHVRTGQAKSPTSACGPRQRYCSFLASSTGAQVFSVAHCINRKALEDFKELNADSKWIRSICGYFCSVTPLKIDFVTLSIKTSLLCKNCSLLSAREAAAHDFPVPKVQV